MIVGVAAWEEWGWHHEPQLTTPHPPLPAAHRLCCCSDARSQTSLTAGHQPSLLGKCLQIKSLGFCPKLEGEVWDPTPPTTRRCVLQHPCSLPTAELWPCQSLGTCFALPSLAQRWFPEVSSNSKKPTQTKHIISQTKTPAGAGSPAQALSLRVSMETRPLQRAGKGCVVLLHHMKRSSGKTGSETL